MIQKEIKVCQQCGGLYVPQGGMFAGKPCVCKYPTELATPPLPQPVKEEPTHILTTISGDTHLVYPEHGLWVSTNKSTIIGNGYVHKLTPISTKTEGEEKMNPFLSNLYDEFSGERKRREELEKAHNWATEELKLAAKYYGEHEDKIKDIESKLSAKTKALLVAVKALYEILSPTCDLSKAKEALVELNSLTNET